MGCGVCADVCPVNQKATNDAIKAGAKKADPAACALNMVPLEKISAREEANWEFAQELPYAPKDVTAKFADVKKSQFSQPLFEFSGACAGCGEKPYVKVLKPYSALSSKSEFAQAGPWPSLVLGYGHAGEEPPGPALPVRETRPDTLPQVAQIVEILLEIDTEAGLLKSLALVVAGDGVTRWTSAFRRA